MCLSLSPAPDGRTDGQMPSVRLSAQSLHQLPLLLFSCHGSSDGPAVGTTDPRTPGLMWGRGAEGRGCLSKTEVCVAGGAD